MQEVKWKAIIGLCLILGAILIPILNTIANTIILTKSKTAKVSDPTEKELEDLYNGK